MNISVASDAASQHPITNKRTCRAAAHATVLKKVSPYTKLRKVGENQAVAFDSLQGSGAGEEERGMPCG